MMRKPFSASMVERIQKAVQADPRIQTTQAALGEASGIREEYLIIGLGLKKSDLKTLESWGLARRGYLREKSGYKKRWIIIDPASA